ncbi:hypothetical protein GCM10011512_01570 [Tersicoccus solisilvae]|uniref:Asp23/Gls24 family envelope stress response protein n=1 Tax=Tersicoccus solisilvae TaxID=1882339 RepID=A0ABQ1NJJ4_9MICC|nr:Asp23/Gls24 family envelope stress response protein [Tersicoccus solisilvae]GGC78659.1 hypothetical protein GCM10011512_01570 [Tersicoccus solisilvae]
MSHPEHEDVADHRPGAVIPEPTLAPQIPRPPEPVAAPETAPTVATTPTGAATIPSVATTPTTAQTLPGATAPTVPAPGATAVDAPGSTAVPVVTTPPAPTGLERGATTVSETAITKVVGVAVRQVPGVHALGSNAARALGQIRDAVGQSDHAQGVSVEVGERRVAVDVTLVAGYPWPLQDVARNVRAAVYDAVEGLIGKDVAEVNVTITDIDVPELDRAPAGRPAAETKERRIP